MKNKAQAKIMGIVFGILFLIAILVFTVLIIINQKAEKIEKDYGEENMDVYLTIKDSQYQTNLDGKYIISNKTQYIFGNAVKGLNEIKFLPNNYTLSLLCSSDGFYSSNVYHNFTIQEQKFNSSKINCYLDKVGNLVISSDGILQNGLIKLNLKIKSIGYYKNLNLCTAWSSGIINIKTNYKETETPQRYKGLVDRCYNLEKSLYNEEITIPFEIKSENLNKLDSINFIIFDKDLFFDGEINNTYSEYNNINLGNPEDSILEVKYEI